VFLWHNWHKEKITELETMKLVVGLGNPGPQYDGTRHNVGFRAVDKLAAQLRWNWNERRSRAILASGMIGAEKVVLVKPLTYMNLSGEAVGELVRWYKLQPYDIFVVCDDLDLPVGKIRLRTKGSAGGQKGLENIIYHLHTNEFPRLRVGIGRPTNSRKDPISYVLGIPPKDERIELDLAEDRAADAIQLAIRQGLETTMNLVNADPEAARKAEEKRQQQQKRREQERLRREQQADQDQAQRIDPIGQSVEGNE
jgi:PTH1 family peptidyl-tRNA hydrolase